MSAPHRHEDASIAQARAFFARGDVHEAPAVLEAERDTLVAHADTDGLDRLADEIDELAGKLRGDDYRRFAILLDSLRQRSPASGASPPRRKTAHR